MTHADARALTDDELELRAALAAGWPARGAGQPAVRRRVEMTCGQAWWDRSAEPRPCLDSERFSPSARLDHALELALQARHQLDCEVAINLVAIHGRSTCRVHVEHADDASLYMIVSLEGEAPSVCRAICEAVVLYAAARADDARRARAGGPT